MNEIAAYLRANAVFSDYRLCRLWGCVFDCGFCMTTTPIIFTGCAACDVRVRLMQIPLTTTARLTLNPFDLLANNICLLCKDKHMITCYDGFEESYRVGDVCVPCYHRLMTEEAQFVEKIFLVRAIDGMLPEMATAIIVLI